MNRQQEEISLVASESWVLVNHSFKGDNAKTLFWFTTKNPLLGGTRPITMIYKGKGGNLLKFIKSLKWV